MGAYDSLILLRGQFDAQYWTYVDHLHKCLQDSRMSNFQLANNVLAFGATRPNLHTKAVPYVLTDYLREACGPGPTN